MEALISFEIFVDYIRVNREKKVSDELALGVRLLDFPTLLIYQPERKSDDMNHVQQNENDKRREYIFNRGKSCFFKINLDSLHTQLSTTPLYAMVLDVQEEIPKLVGSCLISLAKVMDRIRQDVTEHGVSTHSTHGERGIVGVSNLAGQTVGSMSVSYKLLNLGASLLPQVTERKDLEGTTVDGLQNIQEGNKKNNVVTKSLPSDCQRVQSPTLDKSYAPSHENNLVNVDKQDDSVFVSTQMEQKTRTQMPRTLQETENCFHEDLTVFCPPHLYYSNSGEVKSKNEGGDYKLSKPNPKAFTFEDTDSENELKYPGSSAMDQTVGHQTKTSSEQEPCAVFPNVLGEALRKLPLLNALLIELSQLSGQDTQPPLSIHPNLAWIYRPASTELSPGQGNTPRKSQTKSMQNNGPGASPLLKQLHSPRNCSTQLMRPAPEGPVKNKQEEDLIEHTTSSKSLKKKLVYGTTKTFQLRLKKNSSTVRCRECVELIQNETQSSIPKRKAKCSSQRKTSSKSASSQSFNLNENIKTMIESVTEDSIPPKQENMHAKRTMLEILDRKSAQMSEKLSLSGSNKEHHIESNQLQAASDSQKHQSSRYSRHSSPKSLSDPTEEADYADDFNSLEPSDASSPDPASSPESKARTPKTPVHPDLCTSESGSESAQKRAVLPVPIQACSSPQRVLRGTHIIQPRTQASALSFSSDDGARDRSASVQSVYSRKPMTERSSGVESLRSSRGQRSESSGPVRGCSPESVSSFEPQDAEELEDELGSLDFRKAYQHISELVSNKLPGYTM